MENPNGVKSFLCVVAEDIYQKYGDDLSKITIVFPNYRSRIFFNNYLAEIAGKPIWSPRYSSIKDMFLSLSKAEIPDSLELISILYSIYSKHVQKEESFDEFYFWGEILLSDFDDVDKNLVDARSLFSNIRDMGGQIDTYEYLTDEQKGYLKLFFKNFDPDNTTKLKEQFIQLWDALINVYNDFKETLREKEYAYEGMLYRDVVQGLKKNGLEGFESKKYAFVGFNVLNECEKALFKMVDTAGKALFYWDYDIYYTDNQKSEAGKFINEDMLMFKNELPRPIFDNFSTLQKQFTFVSASTENAQARYLSSYLEKIKKETHCKDSDIAVVLCNEGLLLPVLHSIPECVEEMNVTMGFPLSQTPIYSLVLNMLDVQLSIRKSKRNYKFHYSDVASLLRHPYVLTTMPEANGLLKELSAQSKFYPTDEDLHITKPMTLLFRWCDTSDALLQWILDVLKYVATYHKGQSEEKKSEADAKIEDSPLYEDLYEEALFRLYTQISRLKTIVGKGELDLSMSVLVGLIKRMLSVITIPFKGEPVRGMQVMGFLETRNLDFKNVVLLSVNEGNLPNSGKESSFVPYNLRKGYGMTTIDHKNSLYAYYFYRLLQRAENVTMLYNTATEGMSRGQMSRFMLQLMVESGQNATIKMQDIRANVPVAQPQVISIEKTDEIVKDLIKRYDIRQSKDASLSPTALNCYLDCSLKFYFRYVLRLRADDELTDAIESPMFGTIFHKAAELFYSKYKGQEFTADFLNEKASSRGKAELEGLVDLAFKTEFFNIAIDKPAPEYTGEQLIYRKVIIDFLRRLLAFDACYAPFRIVSLEEAHYKTLDIKTASGNVQVRVGGIVDRIDEKDGCIRTVDYKTSRSDIKGTTLYDIFEPSESREGYLVQVFLYATILAEENPGKIVQPSLFYVSKSMKGGTQYVKIKEDDEARGEEVTDVAKYSDEYIALLKNAIAKIFDKKEPFEQTTIVDGCSNCEFIKICRK